MTDHRWISVDPYLSLATVLRPIPKARHLVAWKYSPQRRAAVELTDEDKRVLSISHNNRLADIVQKSCLGVLKAVVAHKVPGTLAGGPVKNRQKGKLAHAGGAHGLHGMLSCRMTARLTCKC
jgi:hypothetical protein